MRRGSIGSFLRAQALAGSFWRLQIYAWFIYFLVIYITFLPLVTGGFVALLHIKATRALFGFGLSSLARLFYRRLAERPALGPIVVATLATSVVLGLAWTILGGAWGCLLAMPDAPTLSRCPRVVIDYSFTMLAWSALYFGVKHWRVYRDEHERCLRAELLARDARLAALQNQLQPHFLFNTLNSIRTLVDEDPARARQMVTEVADFLRYSLERGGASRVSLRDELAATRAYLAIEAIRYEERLHIAIEVEPAMLSWSVPPFVLLPLVENAIKHGFQPGARQLRLRISARRDNDGSGRLEVANSGRWRSTPADARDGTGTGLRNLEERLAASLLGRARLAIHDDDGWVRAVITLAGVEAPRAVEVRPLAAVARRA